MSIAVYTLLMFGCADDGTACQRLAYDAPAYSAAAQCRAQVEPALSSDFALRADFPLVEARCVKLPKQAAVRLRGARTLSVR